MDIITSTQEKHERIYKDTSLIYRANENATVNLVVKDVKNSEDKKIAKIKISTVRSLGIGEKFSSDTSILTVTTNGFGKRTKISQYKVQSRGGSGIKTAKINSKTGNIVASILVNEEQELLALSTKGQIIRIQLSSVRLAGRATQGVRIMNLNSGDNIAGAICF